MQKLINVWDDRRETVFLARRENNLKSIDRIRVDWYFCLSLSESKEKKSLVQRALNMGLPIKKLEPEGDYLRVYVPYPFRSDVVEYFRSKGFILYEADLKLYQRYLADNETELDLNQKILYFDIESDDRAKGIDPGSGRLLSIASLDSDGKIFYDVIKSDTDAEEKRVLRGFIRLVEKYDILEGWFSEGYDLVAIKRRCELHKIPFDCFIISETSRDLGGLHSVRKAGKYRARMDSINHIDLMQKMKEMHYRDTELIKKARSFSLSSIAKIFVNDDKIDNEGKGIYWMWEHEPENLKRYNIHDVELLKKIDDKLNITRQKLVEHQILGARLNDYTSTKKIDAFALRGARLMGKRLFSTNKKVFDEKEEKKESNYAGGYVFEPITGLYENLTVYDFQSLYPSIIKTFNISPDSIGDQTATKDVITLPTGIKFKREIGVIPRIIQSVLDERNRIRHVEMLKVEKDSFEWTNLHYRQYSLKVIANSMYGVMGAEFSRYYKKECAEGITLTGQYLLKLMHKWMTDHGHKPIYGDSDSLFVVVKEGIDPGSLSEEMNKYLGKHVKEKFGVLDNHMSFDYEATYDRFLMQDKKKYVGAKKGKIVKMMGMESKKRDVLPVVEVWQKELIETLLTTNHPPEFYKNWIAEKQTIVVNKRLKKDDLIFQKRISKELDDYANQNLIQVRIAKKLKEENSSSDATINKWSMGAYISWIVTDGSKGLIGLEPHEYKGEYDSTYYWTKAIFPPLQRTLSASIPTVDWDSYYIKKIKKHDDLEERTEARENSVDLKILNDRITAANVCESDVYV